MPEKELPQPRNIFEVINLNIYNLGQNQKTTIDMIAKMSEENAAMRKEVAELRAMFNPPAPEQPNVASGSEGAVTE